jgi:hypothetical protein
MMTQQVKPEIKTPLQTLLGEVLELANQLDSFLQNVDEDGLTLAEIDRLHRWLKNASMVNYIDESYPVTDDRRYPGQEKIWEQIRCEASQIESDRNEQEEADKAFWAEQDKLNEQHYASTRGVA